MRILRHHLYDGGGEVPEGKSTIGHGAYSDGADKSSEIGTLKNLSEGTVEKPDRADPADPFQIVGIQPSSSTLPAPKKKWYKDKPVFSLLFLAIVIGGCLCCKLIMTKDPTYMDLMNYNRAPDREFLFGTDTMGRDIFSMIWYGGRISLFIGLFSTLISTMIAVVFGGISGIAPVAGYAAYAADRNSSEHSESVARNFTAGDSWNTKRGNDLCCNRCDQLDEHCEGCAHRGAPDSKQ